MQRRACALDGRGDSSRLSRRGDTVFLDGFNLWLILLGIVAALAAAFALGNFLSRVLRSGPDADQKSHANVVLTALLGLLALLLAFSFSVVQDRFAARKALVLEEANAIGTTYLRAKMVPSPHSERLRSLLKRYVEVRLEIRTEDELHRALEEAAKLQKELWLEATAVAKAYPESEIVGLFVNSLNETFDLQEERVIVAVHQRFPVMILTTLLFIALLSMVFLGYNIGLLRSRNALPTFAVIMSIALTIHLIVQLDRPWDRLLAVSQQATRDVYESVRTDP